MRKNKRGIGLVDPASWMVYARPGENHIEYICPCGHGWVAGVSLDGITACPHCRGIIIGYALLIAPDAGITMQDGLHFTWN